MNNDRVLASDAVITEAIFDASINNRQPPIKYNSHFSCSALTYVCDGFDSFFFSSSFKAEMRSLRPLPRDGFFFEDDAPNPPPLPKPAPLFADFFVACNDVLIDWAGERWTPNAAALLSLSGDASSKAQITAIEYFIVAFLRSLPVKPTFIVLWLEMMDIIMDV